MFKYVINNCFNKDAMTVKACSISYAVNCINFQDDIKTMTQ